MADEESHAEFDPYYKWLGIPESEQPCNHYRLLGLNLFEADRDVIVAAADKQLTFLRSFQAGTRAAEAQSLLNEVAGARRCLLNGEKKLRYDQGLRNAATAVGAASAPHEPPRKDAPEAGIVGSIPGLGDSTSLLGPIDATSIAVRPTPRAAKRRRTRSRSTPLVAIQFLVVLLVGLSGIGYTVYLNQDRLWPLGGEHNPQAGDPALPPASAAAEEPPASPPGPLSPADPAPQTDAPGRQTGLVDPGEPSFSPPAALAHSERARPIAPPGPEETNKSRALTEERVRPRVSLPPTMVRRLPANITEPSSERILDLGGVPMGELRLQLHAPRLSASGDPILLIPQSSPGCWGIELAGAAPRTLAECQFKDGLLLFCWGDDVPSNLARVVSRSFMQVRTHDDSTVLRFTPPETLLSVPIDLNETETVLAHRSLVAYPLEDLRMEVDTVGSLPRWLPVGDNSRQVRHNETLRYQLESDDRITLSCRFVAKSKALRAQMTVQFRSRSGTLHALDKNRVEWTIQQTEGMLARIKLAKELLPKLQKNEERHRGKKGRVYNKAKHDEARRDLAGAVKLIGTEGRHHKDLEFAKRLSTAANEIHRATRVGCSFYVLFEGHKLPLAVSRVGD